MPIRKQPAIYASLALLALLVALFAPALFQGRILAPLDITTTLLPPWNETAGGAKPHNQSPSDAVTQYLPYRMFAEKSLREDGYIGWNPYEMGGYNLAANTMALPGSWPVQLHRWLPFKDAWNLGIIGEFLVAGLGMLAFLRGRKLPWLPCLIGAVAFMLNAQFIVWIYHRWALGSFSWMPWVLWAFGDGFSTRPLPRRVFLLPAFLTLALLGGSLQHLAFVVLACGCLAAAAFDFRRPLSNTRPLLAWALAFALALGMAAFSLGPQIQGYLSNIAIGHVRGGIGYEEGISQILFHTLLIPARIWPWLAGDPQSMDGWRLLKSGFMSLNYLGTIPMLLGFAGLFVGSMPRAAKWLIAVGLLIPLTPLIGPLYHRVELLFLLGASWMTAEMLHRGCTRGWDVSSQSVVGTSCSHNPSPPRPSFLRRLTWQRLLISTVAAIGLTLLAATCMPAGIRGKLEATVVTKALAKSEDAQFGTDKDWIASRAREWTRRFSLTHPHTAWVYGLLVLGSAGLVLAASRNPNVAGAFCSSSPSLGTSCSEPHSLIANESFRHTAGLLMILAATTLELSTLFHTWTTFSDPADLRPPHPTLEIIRSLAGPHRILQRSPDAGFAEIFATPNLLASSAIPSIDAYESIQYRSPISALGDLAPADRLSLAGVALAIHPTAKPRPEGTDTWEILPLSSTHSLLKAPSTPPPIAVGFSNTPSSPVSILEDLHAASPVHPVSQTPNHLTLDLPADARWLRLVRNWHQGWRWRIPGQSWQTFRNGPDAACWIDNIPAGTRRLEVRFFPRSIWLTIASLASAIAWVGVSVAFGRAGRLASA
jgi:hypothetical protein